MMLHIERDYIFIVHTAVLTAVAVTKAVVVIVWHHFFVVDTVSHTAVAATVKRTEILRIVLIVGRN